MKRLIVFYGALLPAYQGLAWKEVRCSSWCLCQATGCECRQFLGKNPKRVTKSSNEFGGANPFKGCKLILSGMVSSKATPCTVEDEKGVSKNLNCIAHSNKHSAFPFHSCATLEKSCPHFPLLRLN